MKIRIDREVLARGLGRIQAIVERRGTLPILANALIEAKDGRITLAATDLEVSVLAHYDAQVESEGSITLAAKKLFEIVRELDESEVTLHVEQGARVAIECGAARFSLLSISPEEYPTIPDDQGIGFVQLEASLLGEMIDRTLYATSTDETRYNLNGVFMEAEDGKVHFVATDGHRLSRVTKALPGPVDFLKGGIIVPRKGVSEIRKICDETEGTLEIGLGEGFLILRCPDLILSSRLIDGEFPNYRQILPGEYQHRLVVSRERLANAVRRVALVAHERSKGLRLGLDQGQLELSASNPDLGEAREALAVEYSGERFETGFNARYMLDMLGAITAKEIVIEIQTELTPAVFRPADDPDEVAVLMPMRM